MKAEDIEFEESCHACPEAYKMLWNGQEVGYMRLRWGVLTLTAGKYVSLFANDRTGCEQIWEHLFDEDSWDGFKGAFDSDEEKEHFQRLCAEKLVEHYEKAKINHE